jgi:hypothetical protein
MPRMSSGHLDSASPVVRWLVLTEAIWHVKCGHMKIISLVKLQSSIDSMKFVTKPKISDEVSTALGRLVKKDGELQKYSIKVEDGLLVVSSRENKKKLTLSPQFGKSIQRAFDEAEESIERGKRNKQEQAKKAQQELEIAIQDAAHILGVPIIEREEKPTRRFAISKDFED